LTQAARRTLLAGAAALAGIAGLNRFSFSQVPADTFDLVIKGGNVIDPSRGLHARADVGLRHGRIAAIEPDLPFARATRVIDAKGKLVTPGLIDLHAHVYPYGSAIGLPADELVPQTCVTTFVSAGDAGANNFAAFRRYVAAQTRCRVYAFVHIANMGLSGYPVPEMLNLDYANVESAARAIAENHDMVLGVKVRQSRNIVGSNGLEPLKRAIAAVERAGTRGRVMCHIGGVPGELSALLDLLRPRDILTHAYSGSGNNVVQDGKVLAAALAAQKRGVIIDVGHGGGSFDYTVAEPAIQQGLVPDVISSDIHASSGNSPGMPFLPWVMSKFLNMGFSLEQVIAMTTINPARVIGREPGLGTLELGAPGDVSILELVEGPVKFVDTRKNAREGKRWLKPVQAIRAGVPFGKPFQVPFSVS
jgi:dihydroorotase